MYLVLLDRVPLDGNKICHPQERTDICVRPARRWKMGCVSRVSRVIQRNYVDFCGEPAAIDSTRDPLSLSSDLMAWEMKKLKMILWLCTMKKMKK